MMMAFVLVAAAEVAATLTATEAHPPAGRRSATSPARLTSSPSAGEPQLAARSSVPPRPRLAAVRFVRDYAHWSGGWPAAIPGRDASRRVIRLLEHERRHPAVAAAEAVASVRIAPAGVDRYLVTSAVGNFMIAGRGSRWRVVTLPGD
jgi:hypothetical protein